MFPTVLQSFIQLLSGVRKGCCEMVMWGQFSPTLPSFTFQGQGAQNPRKTV